INHATILITDIYEMVTATYPEWGRSKGAPQDQSLSQFVPDSPPVVTDKAVTLLLAEDSDFFRAQVKRYLEEGGYRVLAAEDGEAAWELLLEHLDQVQLVVTDIEMPRLTGLELAQRIRADQRTATLPIIAVSSLAGEEDRERGKAAGVNEYQVKLDRDNLVESIHRLLAASP
ncbi:MAG: response regulator, partial [Thermodesulfobacteriota bacterium]|nr:response regulator [Thermodesulfobacteriota bacterium]